MLFINCYFIKSKHLYFKKNKRPNNDTSVDCNAYYYELLIGVFEEHLLEKSEFSFSVVVKVIDCHNQRKKQIIHFLRFMKVLKTEQPTAVAFIIFHKSVW